MIRQLYFLRTGGTDPYENLATEACLMKHCPQDSAILYLWQNEKTVVIGKNQNPWKECDLPLLQDDGIRLARRKSGGGAVYHDLGNLNFTFLLPLSDYDPLRQLDVICSALRRFGISAQRTGRNDITVDGRKVSGSAFQKSGGIGCHHGTLLVASDVEKMSRYLRPSAEKLQTKGVDSVRSRVVNLQALFPELSVENLAAAVKEAFIQSFSLPCHLRRSERSLRNFLIPDGCIKDGYPLPGKLPPALTGEKCRFSFMLTAEGSIGSRSIPMP